MNGTILLFNRVRPWDGSSIWYKFFYGDKLFVLEQARVFYVNRGPRIYVAYVEGEGYAPKTLFEDTNEAKFAEEVIWPKLESYIAEEKQRNEGFKSN